MSDLVYEIEDLVKKYKGTSAPANDGVSLSIRRGEVFGLLGPNGAGKTTLVRQLAGMSKPTSGNIRFFDIDVVREPNRASQLVALQPQNIWLPAQTKPQEVLETTGRLRGLSLEDAKEDAKQLMEEFGLDKHADKKMQILSGGLRRLMAIAVTLIGHRPVVILDEPTNDLDPEIRRVVWNRIRKTTDRGTTVILVTHNVVEAEQALDRVTIMQEGKILDVGTPAELKERIASHLRLELVPKPGYEEDIQQLVESWPEEVQQTGQQKYTVLLPKSEVENVFNRLLPHLHKLEDFRIITSNLEDIYFELSGGERIAQ